MAGPEQRILRWWKGAALPDKRTRPGPRGGQRAILWRWVSMASLELRDPQATPDGSEPTKIAIQKGDELLVGVTTAGMTWVIEGETEPMTGVLFEASRDTILISAWPLDGGHGEAYTPVVEGCRTGASGPARGVTGGPYYGSG